MTASRVLIIDTPARALWSLAGHFGAAGLEVVEVDALEAACAAVARGVSVLIFHHAMAAHGSAVADLARDLDPDVAIFVIADEAAGEPRDRPAGVEPVRLPGRVDDLVRRVCREVGGARHRRHLQAWRQSAGPPRSVESLIGESEPVVRIRAILRKLAESPAVPVLISGERGTGHSLVARIAHDAGPRQRQPLVRVDCTATITLAGELLGSGDGAGGKGGAVEWSDGGTLVLERVDRLTPDLQLALVRLLEERAFRRVGGTWDRVADVRVVSSTTVDLEAAVSAGMFRRDLYDRLGVVRIDLPPLRRRGRDVLQIAAHVAEREGVASRLACVRIDDSAADRLLTYAWPGNVAELWQVISRAVRLTSADVLTAGMLGALDPSLRPAPPPAFALPADGVRLDDLERRLIVEALTRTGGNQTRAAELLGLHRDQVRYRMTKYGLKR